MASAYTAVVSGVAVSAAQDLFEITAPAAGVVRITGLTIGQSSDYGDAAAEGLGVEIIRGYTSSGSGGSSVTPSAINSRDSAASSAVERNNTTVASGGSPVTLVSDVMNVQAGYQMIWPPGHMPMARNSERMVVRLTAPSDSLTVYATLMFEEE